ncbi:MULTISPECIES: hypothetical protein [Cupriavidus]
MTCITLLGTDHGIGLPPARGASLGHGTTRAPVRGFLARYIGSEASRL